MKRILFPLIIAAALAGGCASTVTSPSAGTSVTVPASAAANAPAFSDVTAGQAMVAARNGYNVAIAAAITYGKLPACSATQRAPCHDPTLLSQMQKADRVAFEALDAADLMLKRPALGTTARDRAIAAAQTALAAFTALTGAIK